jgi:serine/threonine-protein phosphatase 2B catalytic subunit
MKFIGHQVPEPAWRKPTDQELFVLHPSSGQSLPNPGYLKQHFFKEGRLTEQQALFIIEKATELLSREPNLIHVKSPVTSMS